MAGVASGVGDAAEGPGVSFAHPVSTMATTTMSARPMSAARKNTQPIAARGSMSAAAPSQAVARIVMPTPAIISDRRPSPWAVSV